jgi:outer membrane protein OmpU
LPKSTRKGERHTHTLTGFPGLGVIFETEGKTMKKVLFATTALVATASVAAADVTWSGYGRFGMQYEENRGTLKFLDRDGRVVTPTDPATGRPLVAPNVSETNIESRLRLQMDASTETDGGVVFGARFRAEANENADGSASTTNFNGARFSAAYEGFEMQVGNISGAIDALPNFYGYEPGLIGKVGQYGNYQGPNSGYTSTGAGTNGVRFQYNVADFQILGAYNQDNDGALGTTVGGITGGPDVDHGSLHMAYTFSDWTVALGYAKEKQDGGTGGFQNKGVVLTVGGTLGIVDLAFFLAEDDNDRFLAKNTSYGMSGAIEVGAATQITGSISDGDVGNTSYGLGVVHDLGGGVSILGMVGRGITSNNVADLGVKFNF